MIFLDLVHIPLRSELFQFFLSLDLFGYGSGIMGAGPALSLLLAGPSLSLPNMAVILRVIGARKAGVYIALVVVMSTMAGYLYGGIA